MKSSALKTAATVKKAIINSTAVKAAKKISLPKVIKTSRVKSRLVNLNLVQKIFKYLPKNKIFIYISNYVSLISLYTAIVRMLPKIIAKSLELYGPLFILLFYLARKFTKYAIWIYVFIAVFALTSYLFGFRLEFKLDYLIFMFSTFFQNIWLVLEHQWLLFYNVIKGYFFAISQHFNNIENKQEYITWSKAKLSSSKIDGCFSDGNTVTQSMKDTFYKTRNNDSIKNATPIYEKLYNFIDANKEYIMIGCAVLIVICGLGYYIYSPSDFIGLFTGSYSYIKSGVIKTKDWIISWLPSSKPKPDADVNNGPAMMPSTEDDPWKNYPNSGSKSPSTTPIGSAGVGDTGDIQVSTTPDYLDRSAEGTTGWKLHTPERVEGDVTPRANIPPRPSNPTMDEVNSAFSDGPLQDVDLD